MSDQEAEMETENETEMWAQLMAPSLAKNAVEGKRRLLSALSRLNAQISAKDRSIALDYEDRMRGIVTFNAKWKPATVLGRDAQMLSDPRTGVRVPVFEDVGKGLKDFTEQNAAYQLDLLEILKGEMLAYAQTNGILDPKKRRNVQKFRDTMKLYSNSNSWEISSDTEFIE